jgi:hypothetical protein
VDDDGKGMRIDMMRDTVVGVAVAEEAATVEDDVVESSEVYSLLLC